VFGFFFLTFLIEFLFRLFFRIEFFFILSISDSICIFIDTFTRAQLDVYGCSLESEKISDTVLDIADIRKVKMITIIYRDDETRRIYIHLRSVINFWFMRFAISCWSMIIDNLIEKFIEYSCLHSFLALSMDRECMVEYELDTLPFYSLREYYWRI
jgi:hypothetical protein